MKYYLTLLVLFSLSVFADTPPIIYQFTAPLLLTGKTVSIPKADGSHNGYLSSSDFSAFSNPFPSQTGNSGKFLSTNGTSVSWQSTLSSVAWGQITGTLSSQTDLQSALDLKLNLTGGTVSGNISNSVLTASTALVADASKNISSSTTTATELGYVSGVTSAIQTQINAAKTPGGLNLQFQYNNSGAFAGDTAVTNGAGGWSATSLALGSLTASTAIVSDSTKHLISSATTSTELGYVHGVTSDIQTQFSGKQPSISTVGILKSSGSSISAAASSDIIGLFSTCSGVQYLGADGACHNASSVTTGNLTESGSPNLVVTGGTGAVIGSGTALTLTGASIVETTSSVLTFTGATNAALGTGVSIQVKQAGASQSGYLSTSDWNKFNNGVAAPATRTSTISATISTADRFLDMNSSGATTVTLPAATTAGQVYTITNVNTGLVTVSGAANINGQSSIMLRANDSMSIKSNSGAWQIW